MATFRPAHIMLLILSTLLLFSVPADAAKYRCADGAITNMRSFCDNRGGLADGICGDGFIGVGEVCDEGQLNSDIQPNGCRTDCRRYYCGDGVIDSNEQCDSEYLKGAICTDFDKHGVKRASIPEPWYWGGTLRCKDNCSYDLSGCHYCGDGLTQSPQEQCDDGNSVNDDGCNTDCTACVSLNNNLEISSDTQICTKNYSADDYGDLGAIIIKAPNVVLDCDGARLTGQGDGIGIYIKRSDNVTVKNCIIDNYEFGIYAEDSNNIRVLGMGNKMTNTSEQLVLDNSTAQPAPPLTAERYNADMRHDPRAMAGQNLQTKTVPSSVGDALKNRALPAADSAGSSSTTRNPPGVTASREDRRRSERQARLAEREKNRPALTRPAAAPKAVARNSAGSVASAAARHPVITSPDSGERFTAPASVTAKAGYDSKRKVVYALRLLPDKRLLKTSTRGIFRNLAAATYCVSVAYSGKSEVSSPCIEFTVVNPDRMIIPQRQPLPLRRP